MNLEQRVEELEKEVTLLKAKNKLQEINFTTSYSDGSKFNFKEASVAARQQFKNSIAELLMSYSQSNFKNVDCIVQFVLPIILVLLDPISAQEG